jgi:hypothetical protein
MFAGGRSWPSLATDGSSGTSRGHALAMRRPDCRWSGAVARPSVFQAGHIPSWHRSCESYALSPVAGACRWLLLLLSPLLSAPVRTPLPAAPWSSPGDRSHGGGDGPASWPGSLPGPPFPARCPSMAPCPPPPGHLAEPAGVTVAHRRPQREAPAREPGLARRDHGSGCYSSCRTALSDSTPSGRRIGEVSLNPFTMQ